MVVNRRRQDEIFRRWMAEHRGILVRMAGAFADSADRDDLLQEMMMALWHSNPGFRGDSSEATFIYRVVQNSALGWTRGRRRRPSLEALETEPAAADDNSPDSVLARRHREERLLDAVGRLREIDRVLVTLHLEGLSYREMAAVVGLSESNVGVRLNRARKRLSWMLGEAEA